MQSGGGTTTTTQQSSPWVGAQPYLTDLMSQAQQTYQGAQGQNQMPATYAGPSGTTQQALGDIVQRAQDGSPLINTADQSLTNILQPQTAPGSQALQGLLSGYSDPGNNYAISGAQSNAQLNGAAGIGSGLAQMGAQGPNLSAAAVNPYLDQMFSAEAKPVTDAVNAQAGLAGRTGSGAQQQLLTQNLGQLAGQVYGQNFLNEQNLGLSAYNDQANTLGSAANILSGLGQNQAARALQAGGQLSANAANQANVIGSAANQLNSNFNTQNQQSLQAAGFAPSLAGQDYTDLQNMLTAGGAYDTQSQNSLNSLLQQFQYSQQQPWNILSGYAGAISGLGGLGGSSTGSTTQPSQSALPQLIGTGISALPFIPGL